MKILWRKRQSEFIFGGRSSEFPFVLIVDAPSSLSSLDRVIDAGKNARAPTAANVSAPTPLNNPVHRFEESIAGRPYLIEVARVSPDRWRAYIVRVPGVPTALMPFYGSTPAEAARLLTEWLSRAYQRAATGSAG